MTNPAEQHDAHFADWVGPDAEYAKTTLEQASAQPVLELVEPATEKPKTRIQLLQDTWESLLDIRDPDANKIEMATVGKKEYGGRVIDVSRLVIRLADGTLVDEHGAKIDPNRIIVDTAS